MQATLNAPADSSNRAAYLVVLAGICAALHIWKLPPALPELQKELGLSLVESGFLLSLVQMAGMTLGLMVGLFAEKIGLRRCVLVGLLLLSVASAGGTVFGDKIALLLFRALEGCGFLMVTMPAPGLIRRLVQPSVLARVLGVWGCYMPIGTVIILLLGSWLLSLADWRVLWLLMAVVTFLMLAAIARWVPADAVRTAGPQPDRPAADSGWSIVKATLTSRNIWFAALCFGAYSGQWVAVIGFLPSIYVAAGISGTAAGVMTAIVAGSNAFGNLAAGRLLQRGVKPPVLLCTGFAVMAVGAFCAFALDIPATAKFISVLLFSAVGGLIPTTLFLLGIRLAPSVRATSTSIGWLQQCSSFGQFVGPPLVAWVATQAGGWQWTWVATGLCALGGIAMATRLGKGKI
jgi:MFS family permease